MGFLLLVGLLVLTYVRPWDFYPALSQYRLPFWTGNLGLVFGVIGFLLSRRYNLLRGPSPYFFILFCVIVIVSPLTALAWFSAVPEVLTTVLTNVLAGILIMMTARSLRKVRIVGIVLVLCSLWLTYQSHQAYYGQLNIGLVATQRTDHVEELTGERASFGRVIATGQFADSNDLAQALISAAPLLWPLWRQGHSFSNFIWVILPTAALLYGVFLTKSRGAIITIAAVAALRGRETMKHLRTVGPVVLAGSFGAVMMAAGFSGGRDLGGDASSAGRIDAWYDGINMLRGNPIFGVGFGQFIEHHERAAHNSFVHCFAELGLVGYFAWIALLVSVHTDLFALRTPTSEEQDEVSITRWATAVRYSLYAYLTGAFFLSRTYASLLYIILGLGMALSAIARTSGRLGSQDLMRLVAQTTGIVFGSIILIWVIVRIS